MYARVSSALRDKIRTDLVKAQVMDKDCESDVAFILFKPSETHLYKECVEWRECINTYYLSSYRGGALKNFLNYRYIRPEKIFHNKVSFSFEINWNMSWKDWFIERGDHASIVAT